MYTFLILKNVKYRTRQLKARETNKYLPVMK